MPSSTQRAQPGGGVDPSRSERRQHQEVGEKGQDDRDRRAERLAPGGLPVQDPGQVAPQPVDVIEREQRHVRELDRPRQARRMVAEQPQQHHQRAERRHQAHHVLDEQPLRQVPRRRQRRPQHGREHADARQQQRNAPGHAVAALPDQQQGQQQERPFAPRVAAGQVVVGHRPHLDPVPGALASRRLRQRQHQRRAGRHRGIAADQPVAHRHRGGIDHVTGAQPFGRRHAVRNRRQHDAAGHGTGVPAHLPVARHRRQPRQAADQ